jgi:hypothetical protein
VQVEIKANNSVGKGRMQQGVFIPKQMAVKSFVK